MSTQKKNLNVKPTKGIHQPTSTAAFVDEQLELLAEIIARHLVANLKNRKK